MGRVRVTRERFFIALIGTFLLAYLALGVALTRLIPDKLPQRGGSYFALKGYSRDGWGAQRLLLSEPWVLRGSVKVSWVFDPWRSDREVPRIRFEERGNFSEEIAILSRHKLSPIFSLSFPDRIRRALGSVHVTVETRNPFTVHNRGVLGVKIGELVVTPRFGIVLPALRSIGGVLLISLLLLSGTLLSYERRTNSVSLLPPLLILVATTYALSTTYPSNWHLALPAWGLAMLLILGGSVYRFAPLLITPLRSRPFSELRLFRVIRELLGRHLDLLLLTGMAVAAFAVRLFGLDFGLPNFFHPDEFRKSRIVANMIETGDPDPNYFKHPSFLLYGTTIAALISRDVFGNELTESHLAYCGRFVSALLGTLSVPLLFFIGRSLYDRRVGLIASVLFAFCPLHVVCSRYMKEDASLVFFVLLSSFFTLRTFEEGKLISLLLAGLTAGFATSAKYSGMLAGWFVLLPSLAVVSGSLFIRFPALARLSHMLRLFRADDLTAWVSKPRAWQLLMWTPIALTLIVSGFLLITPYSVLNSTRFLADFAGEKRHMEIGHNFALTASSQFWVYHFRRSFPDALSPLTMLLSFLACGFLCARRRWADFFVLSGILLFYLPAEWVRAKPEPQPERYILPCLPFLLLALSAVVVSLARFRNQFLVVVLVILSLSGSSIATIAHAATIKNDTRDIAAEWIRQHIPSGTTLAIDWGFYSPPVFDGRYPIIQLKNKDGIVHTLRLSYLRKLPADYLILSSFTYERFFTAPRNHPARNYLNSLFRELPVVVEFRSPISYGFHNPTIRVLDLRPLRKGQDLPELSRDVKNSSG